MIYLVDTNVLLRFSSHGDPRYQIVQGAVHKLGVEGHEFRTTFQNFAEFWNVSTRPIDQNGFGHTLFETDRILRRFEYFFLCYWIHLLFTLNGNGLSWSMVCQVNKYMMQGWLHQ